MNDKEITASKIENILQKRKNLIHINGNLELMDFFSSETPNFISVFVESKRRHVKFNIEGDECDVCQSLIDNRILKNNKLINAIDLKLSAISSIMGDDNEA